MFLIVQKDFVDSHKARVAYAAGLGVVPPKLVAASGLANEKLGWLPRRGLAEVVSDALRSRRI